MQLNYLIDIWIKYSNVNQYILKFCITSSQHILEYIIKMGMIFNNL